MKTFALASMYTYSVQGKTRKKEKDEHVSSMYNTAVHTYVSYVQERGMEWSDRVTERRKTIEKTIEKTILPSIQ